MAHVFNPKDLLKLDSPDRLNMVNPIDVLTKMGVHEGLRVLDFGVGTGFFAQPALDIVGKGGFLYGVDIFDEMIEVSRKKLQNRPNSQLFKIADLKIPLENSSVDFAFLGFVFHEIEDRDTLLSEIARVLVSSGKIGIMEWDLKNFEKGPPQSDRLRMDETSRILLNARYKILSAIEYSQYHYIIVAEK